MVELQVAQNSSWNILTKARYCDTVTGKYIYWKKNIHKSQVREMLNIFIKVNLDVYSDVINDDTK